MSNEQTSHDPPVAYQIRLKGHLGPQWTDWFDGMEVTLAANGDTLLSGPVADQAALHGLLKKVRDLGLSIVSLLPLSSADAERPSADLRRSGGSDSD